MARPIQTLTLNTHYSIHRRILMPSHQSRTGGGGAFVRRGFERPVYEFVLQDLHANKDAAEALYGFLQYHQTDLVFWYSGDQWGTISTPILFGFGDGATKQFLLNNFWITAGTLATFQDGVPDSPAPSLEAETGLLTYGAAPPLNAKLTATYQCQYLCVFAPDSEILQNEQLFYAKLFSYPGVVIRVQTPNLFPQTNIDLGIWDADVDADLGTFEFDPFVGLKIYYTAIF